MKEEIKRIMKLVQEGKLSAEDAAELIEAFNDAPMVEEPVGVSSDSAGTTQAPKDGEASSTEDPISKFIGSIEKIGKDVAKNVNWQDIAGQIREGVTKGVDAVKKAAEEARNSGGFAVIFGIAQTKHVELPLSIPEGKSFLIELKSGDITIEGGYDIGSLAIDATFRSHDEGEAQNMANLFTPVIEESEHVVVFRIPESPNMSANVIAKIPTGTPVEIRVASGDVKVTSTKAAIRIDAATSEIKVVDASGSIQISDRSGNVSVSESPASILAVDTKSGNVKIDKCQGVIEVKTSSGDVSILGSQPKNLSVEAASGDIKVMLDSAITTTVHLTAVSGDIALYAPDGNNCRVNLSTLRGTVKSGFELLDPVIEERKVIGKLGEGEGSLDISVVTGDVFFGLANSSQTSSEG